MSRVEFAEVSQEEAKARLMSGWLVFQVAGEDVWVEPPYGPVVAQVVVANILVEAAANENFHEALDWLAQRMFSMSIGAIVEMMSPTTDEMKVLTDLPVN